MKIAFVKYFLTSTGDDNNVSKLYTSLFKRANLNHKSVEATLLAEQNFMGGEKQVS